MKYSRQILLLSMTLVITSCITQFVPRTTEDKQILVVEGLITDNPGPNTIKLTKSVPLGGASAANPLSGCIVTVTDDLSNTYTFRETAKGTYVSDPTAFQGVVGRIYTLHISTNSGANSLRYDSYPEEMKPSPAIDSVFYEKQTLLEGADGTPIQEGCQIYLNTHDPTNQTKFYRWEYTETWEFVLPYYVPNKTCWISNNSDLINIKNTSVLAEDRINRYPLNFISNNSDRLKVKYSILVNQYSLNEDEYNYWEKLQNLSEQVGGLYDIIPSSVPSNIDCIDDPNEKVLGYFSVSGSSSKRIFIKDRFQGLVDLYTTCADDTVAVGTFLPNLNTSEWLIINHGMPNPYWVITYNKGCFDCTVRGTNVPPDFWIEGK